MNNYYQLMATVKSKNYYTFVNIWAKATISYSIFHFEVKIRGNGGRRHVNGII